MLYYILLRSDGDHDVQMTLHSSQLCLFYYNSFSKPAAPERQPTSCGRATVPRASHTAALGALSALGVPGEGRGAAAKLGERGASKVAPLGLASNDYYYYTIIILLIYLLHLLGQR